MTRIGGARVRGRTVTAACAALIVVAPLALSGCTSVVFGNAVKASGGPAAGAVDVELLDTGNYPTKPAPPLGAAGTEFNGKLLDAGRMADYVTGPWEVDPAMTGLGSYGAVIIKSAEAMQFGQPKAVIDAVVANGAFIYGFVSARTTDDKRGLFNAVYRFRDPQAAADAAKAMGEAALKSADGTPPPPGEERIPTPIPGHPESIAAVSKKIPYLDTKLWASARSYTPRGIYVLAQSTEVPAGGDDGIPMIAKTLDLQGPAIDTFQPTDPAKFAELPADPQGLIARMLPLPDDDRTVNQMKTFGQHGTLLYQTNPVTSAALFAETGMDAYVNAKSNLYRTKDAASAARVAKAFTEEFLQAKSDPPNKPADGVNFMPQSGCVEFPGDGKKYGKERSFYCTAPADNFVIEVTSGQLRDAQQQVAAQYVMLLAK